LPWLAVMASGRLAFRERVVIGLKTLAVGSLTGGCLGGPLVFLLILGGAPRDKQVWLFLTCLLSVGALTGWGLKLLAGDRERRGRVSAVSVATAFVLGVFAGTYAAQAAAPSTKGLLFLPALGFVGAVLATYSNARSADPEEGS
jgi:hypothetical protein